MRWYKLIFKQNQPIHVGSTKWGVVKETEIFIPGQTMWGALTNAYLQIKKDEIEITNEVKLKEVETYFAQISNFFPAFDEENIFKPVYKNGNFGYDISSLVSGDNTFLSEDKFRFYFVDTLAQTAVQPVSKTAKDETLHEIDYILPQPKQKLEDFTSYLYWIGIISLNDGINYNDFLKKGLKITVGADGRYGYGELELIGIKSLDDNDKEFWWIENDHIILKVKRISPYFIKILPEMEIEGEVQLIPELLFRQNIPIVQKADFYAKVGSKIKSFSSQSSQGIELYKGKLII